MNKLTRSVGRSSSIPRTVREGSASVKRSSHIPRLRFSAGHVGSGNAPASAIRSRSLSRSSLPHCSKLHQIFRRVSTTDKRTVKDTRPLTEKWYIQKSIQQLQEFLTESGYSFPHSTKMLHNPTTKGFFHIFEFLYRRLDPEYTTREKPEEVLDIVKMLQYPFAIKKSHLLVVGRQTWPVLLGLLVWMKDVAQYMDKLDVKMFFVSDNEFEGAETQNLLQQLIAEHYQAFLSSTEIDEDENFLKLAEKLYGSPEELGTLKDERDDVDKKLIELESEIAEYKEMENLINETPKDVEDLQNHIDEMAKRAKQKEKEIEKFEKEMQEIITELQKSKEEVSKLEEVYQAQEISTEDVEYIAVRKCYLTKNIDENKDTLEKAKKELWEEEMASAKRIGQLNSKCSELNKKYQQLRYSLQLNHSINIPEFEFSLSATLCQYKQWTEVMKPSLEKVLEKLKLMSEKDETVLSQEQNVKKLWSSQIPDQRLKLQLTEKKLQQQKELREARTQEMENESASLLQKYNDFNEKVIKQCHQSTIGQQQLRDEVRTLEKQFDKQIENDRNYHKHACALLQQTFEDAEDYIRRIKAKEKEIVKKFEEGEEFLNKCFNKLSKEYV